MGMFDGHEVSLEGESTGVALGAHGDRLTLGLRPGGKRVFVWLCSRSEAPDRFARFVWEVSEPGTEGFRALVVLGQGVEAPRSQGR